MLPILPISYPHTSHNLPYCNLKPLVTFPTHNVSEVPPPTPWHTSPWKFPRTLQDLSQMLPLSCNFLIPLFLFIPSYITVLCLLSLSLPLPLDSKHAEGQGLPFWTHQRTWHKVMNIGHKNKDQFFHLSNILSSQNIKLREMLCFIYSQTGNSISKSGETDKSSVWFNWANN